MVSSFASAPTSVMSAIDGQFTHPSYVWRERDNYKPKINVLTHVTKKTHISTAATIVQAYP